MSSEKASLWHYTTLEGLQGILSTQNLWATDYRYLNDSSEIIYSKHILKKELLPKIMDNIRGEYKTNIRLKQMIDSNKGIEGFSNMVTDDTLNILYQSLFHSKINYPPFVLSFCIVKEDQLQLQKNGRLSQWRGYGKDGGYAIIFNKRKMLEEFELEPEKYSYGVTGEGSVEYSIEGLESEHLLMKALKETINHAYEVFRFGIFKENLRPATDKDVSNVLHCAIFQKHNGFSEEEEYRFYAMPYNQQGKENSGESKNLKNIHYRIISGVLVPYIKLLETSERLPIEAICIGPHKDKKLRERSIKEYVDGLGLKNLNVFSSEIPFIG